jgi:hypothetical protein
MRRGNNTLPSANDMGNVNLIPVLHRSGEFIWMNLRVVVVDDEFAAHPVFGVEEP